MILATLARCLATEGENVLLADPKASSLLPVCSAQAKIRGRRAVGFLMQFDHRHLDRK